MPQLSGCHFIWCFPMVGDAYTGYTDSDGLTLVFDVGEVRVSYDYHPDFDEYFRPIDSGGQSYQFSPNGTYSVHLYPDGRGSAQPSGESGTFQEK